MYNNNPRFQAVKRVNLFIIRKIFNKNIICCVADFNPQVVSERCRIARRATFPKGKALNVSFARPSARLPTANAAFRSRSGVRIFFRCQRNKFQFEKKRSFWNKLKFIFLYPNEVAYLVRHAHLVSSKCDCILMKACRIFDTRKKP